MASVVIAPVTSSGGAYSVLPSEIARIADIWPLLRPHFREAIITLAETGVVRRGVDHAGAC
jgi:hypothetical protein